LANLMDLRPDAAKASKIFIPFYTIKRMKFLQPFVGYLSKPIPEAKLPLEHQSLDSPQLLNHLVASLKRWQNLDYGCHYIKMAEFLCPHKFW
jgi:hypothetical protein